MIASRDTVYDDCCVSCHHPLRVSPPMAAESLLKKGRAGTMTHDYKRNGTTTLFAALNVLDSTVIGRNMQRHRHQEFIRFLNAVEAEVPAGKLIHAILDNYATHKHPKVRGLACQPSPLDLPLHADLGLMAQRRRGLLRQGRPRDD